MDAQAITWIVIAIGLCVLESLTVTLISIWFAVGAFVAAIAAVLGVPLWGQITTFALSSAAVLALMQPVARKIRQKRKEPNNTERMIGQAGRVVEAIDVIEGTGQIKVGGLFWTAKSVDGKIIPKDAMVVVQAIQGVKAIVQEIESTNQDGTIKDKEVAK